MQAGVKVLYLDITSSLVNLAAFLRIRDEAFAFEEIKRRGKIGLPLVVFEDDSLVVGGDTDALLKKIQSD